MRKRQKKKYPGKVSGVLYFECDKLETIESSIKEAYEDAGRIDIFINNAIGGASAAKDNLTVTETSHETCMGLMESILGVSAECARVVIPLMIAGGGGSIVNVSSSTGVQPDVSRTYYGVAKAAVNMLTAADCGSVRKTGNSVQCSSAGIYRVESDRESHAERI